MEKSFAPDVRLKLRLLLSEYLNSQQHVDDSRLQPQRQRAIQTMQCSHLPTPGWNRCAEVHLAGLQHVNLDGIATLCETE